MAVRISHIHPVSLLVFLVGVCIGIVGVVLAIVFGTRTCASPTCPPIRDCKCNATIFTFRTGIQQDFIKWDDSLKNDSTPNFAAAKKKLEDNFVSLLMSSVAQLDSDSNDAKIITDVDNTKNAVITVSQFDKGKIDRQDVAIAFGFGAVATAASVPTVDDVGTVISNDKVAVKQADTSETYNAFCTATNDGNMGTTTTVTTSSTIAISTLVSGASSSSTNSPQTNSPTSSPSSPSSVSSGPAVSSTLPTTGSSVSGGQTSTSQSTQPSTTPTTTRPPITLQPCGGGTLRIKADIAVVYELANLNSAINLQIENFIKNVLFNYTNNPYALGTDTHGYRASKVSPIPYPSSGSYLEIAKSYGNADSLSTLQGLLELYNDVMPSPSPPPNVINIDDGLTYVNGSLNRTLTTNNAFWQRFIIVIGNDATTVSSSKATADSLNSDSLTDIITVAYNANGDFSPLTKNNSFSFTINSPDDDLSIAQEIGTLLSSISSVCFYDTPLTTTTGPQTSPTSTNTPPTSPSTTKPSTSSPTSSPSTSQPAQSTSPPSSPSSPVTTQSTSPPTTTPCPTENLKFYGDLALLFELKNPDLDITKNIESYITQSFFTYAGNPYALDYSDWGERATTISIVPYPRSFDYPLLTNYSLYGAIQATWQIPSDINIWNIYATSSLNCSNMTIYEGLEYVECCITDDVLPRNRIPPRYVVIIANGYDAQARAEIEAQWLKDHNYTIIVISFESDQDFSNIASSSTLIFPIKNANDYDTVSKQVGDYLFSQSQICHPDTTTYSTTTSVKPPTSKSSPQPSGSSTSPSASVTVTSPSSLPTSVATSRSTPPPTSNPTMNTGTSQSQTSPNSAGTSASPASSTSGQPTSLGSSPSPTSMGSQTPNTATTSTVSLSSNPSPTTMSSQTPNTAITSTASLSSNPSPTTTMSPSSTTSSNCVSQGGQLVYYGDLAVAFELRINTTDLSGIETFIYDNLLTATGTAYGFDYDHGVPPGRYTLANLFPYPATDSYSTYMQTTYGQIYDKNGIKTTILIYNITAQGLDTKNPNIQDAFTYIQTNVNSTPASPVKAVILVANNATNVAAANDSANALKAMGYAIITIGHSTTADFSSLATKKEYAFNIPDSENRYAVEQAVSVNVSNILVSLSSACFFASAPTFPTTISTTPATTTVQTTTACPPGPQILAIAYELNTLDPTLKLVTNATQDFILNNLVMQNYYIPSLMMAGKNLSVVAFPVGTNTYNTSGDFGEISSINALKIALWLQSSYHYDNVSDILSGLNYVENEAVWKASTSNSAITRTILIIANSAGGVNQDSINKANALKAGGASIVTLAMKSADSFDLSPLSTNSNEGEYSLQMNYNADPSVKTTTAIQLDALISKLASPCKGS